MVALWDVTSCNAAESIWLLGCLHPQDKSMLNKQGGIGKQQDALLLLSNDKKSKVIPVTGR
jgi:hypothetical protein